ncbi:GspE/PulE family protein [Desulfatirhabdium butyrativorans]|uniref:GspE/PulE family protein n=1 Tax=Desulfatirhabdium butyrativorans TaxID=340467 RepID=UPI000488519F|nr:GspE/PulE family protein [Desulfatirhabdium butyrativorans]
MSAVGVTPFGVKQLLLLLHKGGLITEHSARQALREALRKIERAPNAPNGFLDAIDAIVALHISRKDIPSRLIDEDALYPLVAQELDLPYIKIDPLKLDLKSVTSVIPRSFALKHLVVPLGVQDGKLTVACADPFNREAIDDIARAGQTQVQQVLSTKSDIVKLINDFFGFRHSIEQAETQFGSSIIDLGNLEQFVHLKTSDELASTDRHIVNAVNYLFSYAFDQRASDIHVEPKREASLVRMRIDGVLHTIYRMPKAVHPAIISRIKNLCRMDMAEKRKPQDGRIKIQREATEVEIRVSTVPVAFGEKVVMRIMDPNVLFQDLDGLGFTATDLIRYNRFIRLPHGIVLVCGPTGSGKSTTLYSTLRMLSTPEINLVTIEDPIEMVCEDFNQIGVQPLAGVTFATILRNILRQDPDIIMVGELRDLETAQNAIQSALTGHLVLSTIHTNDAPSTIIRLLDLGIPAFLIQASLVGVLAQRLVRKICPDCKESFVMKAEEFRKIGLQIGEDGDVVLYRGKGCTKCRGTGYYGRLGIFEVLSYTDELKRLTTDKTDIGQIRDKARQQGMVSLRENALNRVLDGTTTYQEALRVTWGQE